MISRSPVGRIIQGPNRLWKNYGRRKTSSPARSPQRGAGVADDLTVGPSAAVVHLENVPETEHDATVSTVCAPLVKEVS